MTAHLPALRKRRWLILLPLAGIAVAGIWLARSRGPAVDTLSLSTAPLEQRVVASGRVSAVSRVQVGS